MGRGSSRWRRNGRPEHVHWVPKSAHCAFLPKCERWGKLPRGQRDVPPGATLTPQHPAPSPGGPSRAVQSTNTPGSQRLSCREALLVCVGIWLRAVLLLANGGCKTPRAQNRYDVFLGKGYEVSDITEVLSIQIADVSGLVSGVKSSDPSIAGSAGADAVRAPRARRWSVAGGTRNNAGGKGRVAGEGRKKRVFSNGPRNISWIAPKVQWEESGW